MRDSARVGLIFPRGDPAPEVGEAGRPAVNPCPARNSRLGDVHFLLQHFSLPQVSRSVSLCMILRLGGGLPKAGLCYRKAIIR